MTTCVFTYGSLMFAPVWQRVVTGDYRSVAATIHGFRRLRVRGEHYPALIASNRTDRVQGLLYLDIDEDDLARLDRFEGQEYVRLSVPAFIDDERWVLAEAYLATPALTLEPIDWDPVAFEREGLAPFIAGYLARREATGA